MLIESLGDEGDRKDWFTDICIVGAGAAGLTLAARLGGRGTRVTLLEAGGLEQTEASQAFYAGEVVDPETHWPLDRYRVRALGGTSRIWGGRLIPYDPIDFSTRSWVPHSGWPIGPEALDAYYPAAVRAAEGGDYDYAPSGPIVPGLDSEWLATTVERFSRPTDFWARYGPALKAGDVRVVTGAAVTAVRLDANGGHVDHIEVRCGDVVRRLRARRFVLAMGGLETARLLLASNDVLPHGIGNGGDWLGRGYMCHLAATFGEVRFNGPPRSIGFDYERDGEGVYLRRRIALTERAQRELQVMNFTARLHIFDANDPGHRNAVLSAIFLAAFTVKYEYSRGMREADRSPAVMLRHLGNIARDPWRLFQFARTWGVQRYLASRRVPSIALYSAEGRYPLEFHSEQAPNRASRITLTDAVDAHGVPRMKVDWQVTPLDFATIREGYRLMARELARTNTGRLSFDDAGLEAAVLKAGAYGGHHSGTARMAASPRDGVVDADCRVHGVDNLYVASGAVLPTSSQANPTLTILALALRLADHLEALPAPQPVAVKGPVKVLVTGAAGFVGRAVVRQLAAAGFHVRAGTRNGAPVPGAAESCVCDVLDRTSVSAALAGMGAVVNCAVGTAQDTDAIVEGTRTLVEAARIGSTRLIQMSSVAVYSASDGLLDETAATDAPHGAYGRAKLEAERLCRDAAAAGLAVTVLRPALVWGAESGPWTRRYVDALRSGRWHALGKAGEGWANLIHVDDLAGFVTHLLGRPAPRAEEIYNVAGAGPPTWNAYLEALQSALRLPPALPPRRSVGTALAGRLGVRAAERLGFGKLLLPGWEHVRGWADAVPSRDETGRFAAQARYDIHRMLGTGFTPQVDLAKGIAEIAAAAPAKL